MLIFAFSPIVFAANYILVMPANPSITHAFMFLVIEY